MPTFALAAQAADVTGAPVAEGFAVQIKNGADAAPVTAALQSQLPKHTWTAEGTAQGMPQGWLMYRAGNAPLPLGAAWDAVRAIKKLPAVEHAEPMLLTRLPLTNGSEAQRAFELWGKIDAARLAKIQAASDKDHMHWSLEAMGLVDKGGRRGAWSLWQEKHPGKTPGEGILVAHPDTGYTKHTRLLPHLKPHDDNPNLYGKDFVERNQPDGFDPMQDRTLGNFPGHGTSTASIIATGDSPDSEPWGVAPGAKVLPLRVSSSVIHLSFQNVCDAFVEAMAREAHVISMSLGGPLGSGLLNSLVRQALDKGIIIVSAVGNYIPTVVFPAHIPGVIACTASNALTAPWRFSGLGAEAAITAPGELVWHDTGNSGGTDPLPTNGDGTSFATANVAGLAALWLSFHGREDLVKFYKDPGLIPFAFRLCLQQSADSTPAFIKGGKGGFGAGIAQADKLLGRKLPTPAEAAAEQKKIFAQTAGGIIGLPINTWSIIATLPTLTADGPRVSVEGEAEARGKRIAALLNQVVGPDCDEDDRAEIGALASTDAGLQNVLAVAGRNERGSVSPDALRRYLLDNRKPISQGLKDKLAAQRAVRRKDWRDTHASVGKAYPLPDLKGEDKRSGYTVAVPTERRLRAFAFDPSLATQADTAAINEITIPVLFERGLQPGPVGEYLEVVDVDPASDCAYAPVDLNHPYLLAQAGLAPSESNPQFHQQMVYAVAMKTIRHFEEALGRPIFWSPLRPWNPDSKDDKWAVEVRRKNGRDDRSDQFVQRLRLYPHALRAENAYYSPQKRAILFGYFPAGDSDPGAEYPGGVVFSCLSHDIVAHETTHAILDGMHVYFTEPTNPDVYAFHEAFADIVALFQHFTYPEVLRDQIARASGDLGTGTLLTQLAMQFGRATGQHQALRDALGAIVLQRRVKGPSEWRDQREDSELDRGEGDGPEVTIRDAARSLGGGETRRVWKRYTPDPSLQDAIEEPHARGSLLVAAVFDAFLTIYESRIDDLKRIATGGTGVLPNGRLHPDLVRRMADEAAKSAGHVLRMCIRAMDYVPPIDITFGEFLRALITADYDLVPHDPQRYRVAFIDAFRKWGIYPRDVRTLSEESLRWCGPEEDVSLFSEDADEMSQGQDPSRLARLMRRALLAWEPGKPRQDVFAHIHNAQAALNNYLWLMKDDTQEKRSRASAILTGLEIPPPNERKNATNRFSVANLRPARRIGPNGEFLTEMVFEIVQTKRENDGTTAAEGRPRFRGGVTLIVSMDDWKIRYVIRKSLDSELRHARPQDYALRAAGGTDGAAEYSSQAPPDLTDRASWFDARVREREAMRVSSCNCRNAGREATANRRAGRGSKTRDAIPAPTDSLAEPFAMLHQN